MLLEISRVKGELRLSPTNIRISLGQNDCMKNFSDSSLSSFVKKPDLVKSVMIFWMLSNTFSISSSFFLDIFDKKSTHDFIITLSNDELFFVSLCSIIKCIF